MAFGYSTTVSPFNQSTAIVSDVAKQLISHLINKRRSPEVSGIPRLLTAAGRQLIMATPRRDNDPSSLSHTHLVVLWSRR